MHTSTVPSPTPGADQSLQSETGAAKSGRWRQVTGLLAHLMFTAETPCCHHTRWPSLSRRSSHLVPSSKSKHGADAALSEKATARGECQSVVQGRRRNSGRSLFLHPVSKPHGTPLPRPLPPVNFSLPSPPLTCTSVHPPLAPESTS